MRRKILIYLGISVLSLVVFFVAIFYTLPYDNIRHFAEKEIEKTIKQSHGVEIGDISISPLLNITAKNFRMTPRSNEPQPPVTDAEGTVIDGFYCAPSVVDIPFIIDKIYATPALFSTLKKKPAGNFELQIKDGTINGELKSKDKIMEITANGQNLSLNDITLLSNLAKMQIYGTLGFDLRTILDGSNIATLSATLTSQNTVTCPKRINIKMSGGEVPYDLPFTVFGNIKADVEIKNNRLVINSLTSDGPDIKLNVTGDIALKSPKEPNMRFNLVIDVAPDAKWVEAHSEVKMIYQKCEKLEGGAIHLTLKGTPKRPKWDCGTPIPEPIEEVAAPEPAPKPEAKPKEPEKAAPKPDSAPEKAEPAESPKAEKKRLDAGNEVFRPKGEGFRSRDMGDAPSGERPVRSRDNGNMPRPSRPSLDNSARSERFNRELDKVDADFDQAMRRSGRAGDRMPRRGRGNPNNSDN